MQINEELIKIQRWIGRKFVGLKIDRLNTNTYLRQVSSGHI